MNAAEVKEDAWGDTEWLEDFWCIFKRDIGRASDVILEVKSEELFLDSVFLILW